jgi:hypothetical protein
MDLTTLIDVHPNLPRLSSCLDVLGNEGRVWAVQRWTRANMAALWDAAQGFRPVTLDDFVPATVGPFVEVIHSGKNSLPAATLFEKRFCRPALDPQATQPTLLGYNEQPFALFVGSGYYMARPSGLDGEVDIDYTMLPTSKPAAWPPIRSNSERLGRWVYAGMIDVVRGLSSHVTIGRARKKSGWMDTWFVLVRQDPAPAT